MEFQNSVSDFDLNLLAPPPKKLMFPNKQQKRSAVNYLKSKVLLTHNIVQNYHATKLELDKCEQELDNSRKELNNLCIEYRGCLEKRTVLEKTVGELRNENLLISQRCINAETHYEGLQSHIKQLQVLITEYETEIKNLKSELKAKKDSSPPVRLNKKSAVLSKENAMLKKHIGIIIDVILNKKKVNSTIQHILDKYVDPKSDGGKTLEHEGNCNDDFEEVSMCYSEESFDTVIIAPTLNATTSVGCHNAINRNNSVETETIDGRSVDTGRGSSLAFSDGEKSFHSPEYYMGDSPLSSETVQNNEKSYKDGSTSPMVDTPKCTDNFTSPIPRNEVYRDCSTSPMPIHRKSIATSPIIFERNTVYIVHDPAKKVERGVSPIKIVESWRSTRNKSVKEFRHVAVDTKSLDIDVNNRYTIRNERECLERNNSVILSEYNRNDPEVEMILSEMRLHQQLITPIPPTPIVNNRIHRASKNRIDESIFDIVGRDVPRSREDDVVHKLLFSKSGILGNLFAAYDEMSRRYSFNSQVDLSSPLVSNSPRNISNKNTDNSEVPNNEVENEEHMNIEDSVMCEEIGSKNNDICDSAIINNVHTINQANSQLDTIEEESDNDLIIIDDKEPDDIPQTDIQCERVSSEPLNILNKTDSLEKPTKPLRTNRKLRRKLTGLDKLRMKCIFKSKIKQQLPTKKRHLKPKKLTIPKKVTENDTAASLNDKDVYAKAVKVMAELKSNNFKKIPIVAVQDCSKMMNTLLSSPPKNSRTENDNTNSEVQCSPETNVTKPSQHNDKRQNSNNSAVCHERRTSIIRLSFTEMLGSQKERLFSSCQESNTANLAENNDKPKSYNNSAAFVSNERRKSNKRLSISEICTQEDITHINGNTSRKSVKCVSISDTETIEGKRVSRSRQKSNVSLTIVTNPTMEQNIVLEHINNSGSDNTNVSEPCVTSVKRILRSNSGSDKNNVTEPCVTSVKMVLRSNSGSDNKNMSEPCVTPIKSRLRKRQSSDESTKDNNNSDKTTPSKRSSISIIPNILSPSQRISGSDNTNVSEPCVTPVKSRLKKRQSSDESTKDNNSSDETTPSKRSSTSDEPKILSPSQKMSVSDNSNVSEPCVTPVNSRLRKRKGSDEYTENNNSSHKTTPTKRSSTSDEPKILSPSQRMSGSDNSNVSELCVTPVKSKLRKRKSSDEHTKNNNSSDETTLRTKRSSTSDEPNILSPSQRMSGSDNTNVSEPCVTSVKRILRSHSSNESIKDNTNKTTPTKRCSTSFEPNIVLPNQKNLESDSTNVSELCVTPAKRSRMSSGASTKSNKSNDKTTPTKRTSLEGDLTSPSQRLLRSSIRQENKVNMNAAYKATNIVSNIVNNNSVIDYNIPNKRSTRVFSNGTSKRKKSSEENIENINLIANTDSNIAQSKSQIDYGDLDMFSADSDIQEVLTNCSNTNTSELIMDPKESLFCSMIERYGVTVVKYFTKKPPDSVIDKICEKLEKDIENIIKLNESENKRAVMKLVTYIQHLDIKEFICGLMKYLKDPNRKTEMYNLSLFHPAPPMTKSEQVLLFIIAELRNIWRDVELVDDILTNIEYTLFNLTRSPTFHMIESMAHFYAVLCKYYTMQSRLRLFVLDSLYCLQFKAVPLIKQCLEVWMHILPLAHMGMAKQPLVTCLVYLLHFYKCEDKFNRVQDLRITLKRKYFYNISQWNETMILDLFRTSVKDLRVNRPDETRMLRSALITLGKRQGPKWCLKNIINGILQPMLENSPHHVKLFCILMMGPLMKPFPTEMKVHCEIVVTKLLDLLHEEPPQDVAESVFTTLITFSKHNEMRLNQYLLKWKPSRRISAAFEEVLKDYVKSKPVKTWKVLLRKCFNSN